MPNLDTIRKSQERRAAREAKVEANKQEAKDQEYNLAKLSEDLQKARGNKPVSHVEGEAPVDDSDPEGASIVGDRKRPDSRASRDARARSRGEQKIMRQLAAEKQADKDAQATVAPDDPDEVIDLSIYTNRGIEPPLHVLNKLAVRADRAMRDEAREVGQAVGRAAMDVLTERRATQSRESRMNKVAGQMTNIAKQNALNAAKAAKTE